MSCCDYKSVMSGNGCGNYCTKCGESEDRTRRVNYFARDKPKPFQTVCAWFEEGKITLEVD